MIIPKEERTITNMVHKKMHELWRSMLLRCYSKANGSYHNYGGRGVLVTEKWLEYEGFLDDIDSVEGYDLDKLLNGELQLDKDVKGDGLLYSLDTCKFVTRSENSGNRRNNKTFIAIHLEDEIVLLTKNREELCRDKGLDSSTVWRMLQRTSGNVTSNKAPVIYKGWVFYYIEHFSLGALPSVKVYVGTHQHTGEVVYFRNQAQFARDKGINSISVSACIHGRQKKAGDWNIKNHTTIYYKDSTTIQSQVEQILGEVE